MALKKILGLRCLVKRAPDMTQRLLQKVVKSPHCTSFSFVRFKCNIYLQWGSTLNSINFIYRTFHNSCFFEQQSKLSSQSTVDDSSKSAKPRAMVYRVRKATVLFLPLQGTKYQLWLYYQIFIKDLKYCYYYTKRLQRCLALLST